MSELAEQLGVSQATVKSWNQAGLLRSHPYNDKNECLFEFLGDEDSGQGQA